MLRTDDCLKTQTCTTKLITFLRFVLLRFSHCTFETDKKKYSLISYIIYYKMLNRFKTIYIFKQLFINANLKIPSRSNKKMCPSYTPPLQKMCHNLTICRDFSMQTIHKSLLIINNNCCFLESFNIK